MINFVAIDFETANNEPTSICSVGAVLVREGDIVDHYYHLVQPEPNYYLYRNMAIHGITPEQTEHAPTFDVVWRELFPFIGSLPLVAHNKAFDERCLRAVCRCYGIETDISPFFCTLSQARRLLKRRLPNFQLHTVAQYFGYDLQQHHHALADAEACAHIAIHLFDPLFEP